MNERNVRLGVDLPNIFNDISSSSLEIDKDELRSSKTSSLIVS